MNAIGWKDTELMDEVLSIGPDGIGEYLEKYVLDMAPETRPFSKYMRETFRNKGISEKEVFSKAKLSNGYGYKLISEEKKTGQRDVIIKLCLAMHMNVAETQRALNFSGFAALYPGTKRDVILLVAINNEIFDIGSVNTLLTTYGEKTLDNTKETES